MADNSAFGPYIQFLLLTGCRRDEAASLTWSEIKHKPLDTAGRAQQDEAVTRTTA